MATNKPVPSKDPSDLLFNAEKLDQVVNDTAPTFTDRKGQTRQTLKGLTDGLSAAAAITATGINRAAVEAALSAVGYYVSAYLVGSETMPNNGVINAHTIIQRAVDALADDYENDGVPRVLLLPAGAFKLNNFVQWRRGVGLKGVGNRATILKPQAELAAIYGDQNGLLSEWFEYCFFQDFGIDGADQTGTGSSHAKGVFLQFLRNSLFSRVAIRNIAATGFGIDYLDGVTLLGCEADNCGRLTSATTGAGAGFGIATGQYDREDCLIALCRSTNNKTHGFFTENKWSAGATTGPIKFSRGFTLVNSYASGNQSGFCDAGSDGAIVVANQFLSNRENGVYLGATPANGSAGVNGQLSNNIISDNGTDTASANPGGIQLRQLLQGGYTIRNNTITRNFRHGVLAGGSCRMAAGVAIDDNRISLHVESGIRIYIPDLTVVLPNLRIRRNDLIDNATDIAATYNDGMTIAASLKCPSIRDNVVINTTAGAGKQRYAVYLRNRAVVNVTEKPIITGNEATDVTGATAVSVTHTVDDSTNVANNYRRLSGVSAPSVEWSDAFARADAALTGSATETGGKTWASNGSGSAQVISNAMGFTGLTAGQTGRAYVGNGTANGIFQATCAAVGAAHQATLLFRYTGGSGFELTARETGSNFKWTLQKRDSVAGLSTIAVLAPTSADGDVLKVTCDGTTVTVDINGVQQYSGTLTDYTTTGVNWGVVGKATDGRWDSFSFAAL